MEIKFVFLSKKRGLFNTILFFAVKIAKIYYLNKHIHLISIFFHIWYCSQRRKNDYPHLHSDEVKPFTKSFLARIFLFTDVFCKVVVAQVKISSINTILTAIYIFALLPSFGISMPYGGTIVLLTFLLGLIPVLGNLIVNTIVVIISLTVSFKLAITSLVFLMVIHKLEYYINAKVVGGKMKIYVWETYRV